MASTVGFRVIVSNLHTVVVQNDIIVSIFLNVLKVDAMILCWEYRFLIRYYRLAHLTKIPVLVCEFAMIKRVHIQCISYQELFGAIGPIKRARLLKEGVAEVVYLNKEDVQKAIQKYNNRELDGKDVSGMARRHFFLQ